MSTTMSKTAGTSITIDELHEEDIDRLVKVLQQQNFHSSQLEEHDMHNNGHVNTLVQEPDTQKSTKLSRNCWNCRCVEHPGPQKLAAWMGSTRGAVPTPTANPTSHLFSNGEKCENLP